MRRLKIACFNPTLVRLRQLACSHRPPGRPEFQSHAGSIEAYLDAWPNSYCKLAFQSHAGSIEAGLGFIWVERVWNVSIPRWFD